LAIEFAPLLLRRHHQPEAREIIEEWRIDYNTERPHSSLKYQIPEEFAAARPFDKTQWAQLSIGIESGPHIGMQKGPLRRIGS